jgi:uncharacterized protein (DUF3820 family)
MKDEYKDYVIAACLLHDTKKYGFTNEIDKSEYKNHAQNASYAFLRFCVERFEDFNYNPSEFLLNAISSHMGQWSTDKKSSVVLPKPEDVYQHFVHLADYLASRKDLTMAFDKVEMPPKAESTNIDDYVISFGKYKGTKLVDLYKKDRGYCMWLKENSYQREVVEMIKQIEAKQTQEDDEI